MQDFLSAFSTSGGRVVLPSFTGVNIVCPSKVRKAVGERAPTALHEKLLAQRLIVRLRMALFDGIQEDTQEQRCHSDTDGYATAVL